MKGAPLDPLWLAVNEANLASLRSHGDIPSIPREIDINFYGPADHIGGLVKAATNSGWKLIDTQIGEDGIAFAVLSRIQTAEPATILELTEEALELERGYTVAYDGWGCIAQERSH